MYELEPFLQFRINKVINRFKNQILGYRMIVQLVNILIPKVIAVKIQTMLTVVLELGIGCYLSKVLNVNEFIRFLTNPYDPNISHYSNINEMSNHFLAEASG